MKKKLLSMVLAMCMVVTLLPAIQIEASAAVWGGTAAGAFAGGDGLSEATAFQIATAEQLMLMNDQVNNANATVISGSITYGNAFYKLTADIQLNDTTNWYAWDADTAGLNLWTPIGNITTKFKGTFDGDGHTVSGIYISGSTNYQGLFGWTDGACIQNLGIVNGYIKGDAAVGGLVGYNTTSSITNCENAGTVIGSNGVGGIAGYSMGAAITNCVNHGAIIGLSGASSAGGIAGYSNSTVTGCVNKGPISGGGSIGGVVGWNATGGTVMLCVNTAAVTASANDVGGVVGHNRGSTVRYSYNTASVSGGQYTGGVVGRNYEESATTITEYCYNAGPVYGLSSGGIAGYTNGTLQFCYNSGSVSGANAGGVLSSQSEGTVTGCYYDKQMCPCTYGIFQSASSTGAEGTLTAEMVGTNLSGSLGDPSKWLFEDGLYPRLTDGLAFGTTNAAYLSATPLFLTGSETISAVTQNFTVGTGNSVTWDSDRLSVIGIVSNTATVTQQSSDTDVVLTATLGTVSRTVKLTVAAPPTYAVSAATNAVDANGVTAAATFGASPYLAGAAATVTITLSGTAAAAGTHTIGLTGDGDAGAITPPATVTKTVLAGATPTDAFLFTFTMPANTVDDLAVTHTFVPSYTGGGDPYTPPSNGADIIVNGRTQSAGTASNATQNGQRVTTVTVDSEKLKKLLAAVGNGASVIIPVTSDADVATGALTGRMVKEMEAKEATLEIRTSSATYTLPASEINIDAISEQFGQSVSLSDIHVEISIAQPSDATVTVVENAAQAGTFSLVIPAVDFFIRCTYNGQTTDVSQFRSYVERSFAIAEGVDPTKITTAIVVDAEGTLRHVPTRIIIVDGKYYAVINSLSNSTYTVVYNPIEFSDAENHWAKAAINDMGSRMVIDGIGNNNYAPDREITRAEVAAIVVRALGLEVGMGNITFSDVNESDWYCGYVETAASYSIITGRGDGTFGPNDKITREQAMTMIARAMKWTGLEANLTDGEISAILGGFADSAQAAGYAKAGIGACLKTGIVTGKSSGTIAPADKITRAEVAVMIQRLLQKSQLI